MTPLPVSAAALAAFHDSMTLKDARDELRKRVQHGHECPCCKQFAKVYKRRLNHVPAAALIALYREAGREFAHLPTIVKRRLPQFANQGGYTVLSAHWKLIEEERASRPDGGRTGYWRVTTLGEDFILRRASVPSHAELYDDRLLKFYGDPAMIEDCLGKRFNYAELMSS